MLHQNPNCLVLCVTEHWKSEQQLTVIGIQGFKLASSFCREEGHHGGAAIYLRQNTPFQVNKKLCKLSVCGSFECAGVDFKIGKSQIICYVIYRPPNGNKEIFFVKLEELLTHLDQNKLIIITGDFNIDMSTDNYLKHDLLSLMYSFSLKPKIHAFTRVTANSQTCLDNIFINCQNSVAEIMEYHISDHSAQKVTIPIIKSEKSKIIYKRCFMQNEMNNFKTELQQQDWQEVLEVPEQNVNEQWDAFILNFINIFNMCFPKKSMRMGQQKKSQYLNNAEVQECKNRLDTLLILSRYNENFKTEYNNTKKEYDRLIIEQRKKNIENRIYRSDNKSKTMWSLCNELRGQIEDVDECKIPGQPHEVANAVNRHLTNIVPNLMKNLEHVEFNCEIPQNEEELILKPIKPDDLLEISKRLKNKFSSGADEIPIKIVKLFVQEIREVLCYIINNSLKYGIFPEQLKVSEIKPLLKKGDPELIDNHRPISLLNSFSKLFEYVVSIQITDFMHTHNLFNPCQHGYIKERSTISALYEFTQHIIQCLENKQVAMGLFLDLSKAYDCLDHSILYQKLLKYGLRANILSWIKSYLSNRQQCVVIKTNGSTTKSDIAITNVGIPQGSVLGPILFVVYINDLSDCLKNMDISMINYADDTSIIVQGSNMDELCEKGQKAFTSLMQWFTMNKLIVNKEKTDLIIFRSKRSQVEVPENITFSNAVININKHTKVLGIHLDEFISWNHHIDFLTLKLSKISYGIRVLSKYLESNCIRIIYFANFESVIRYGILLFGGSSDIQKAFIIQKRTIRTMNHMQFNQTCRGVFKSLGIMTVYALYIYECIMFTVKNRNKFCLQNQHEYNTRNTNILLPAHRLTLTEKNSFYRSAKFYNKLPDHIKRIHGIASFKRKLKLLLIQLEPYSILEFLGGNIG